MQLIKELINSKLRSEDISELFKINVIWVFIIRNMSSINCVNYESKDNPFSEEINIEVRQKDTRFNYRK